MRAMDCLKLMIVSLAVCCAGTLALASSKGSYCGTSTCPRSGRRAPASASTRSLSRATNTPASTTTSMRPRDARNTRGRNSHGTRLTAATSWAFTTPRNRGCANS